MKHTSSVKRSVTDRGLDDEAAFIADALRAEAAAIVRVAEGLVGGAGGGAGGGEACRECWRAAIDLLASCTGHVVVSGMGKSGLVGQKVASTLSSLGQPSHFMHPADAVHGDLGKVRRGDVVMLMSYSGATDEVVNLAAILRANDVPTLGVSRDDKTKLAELCTVHISVGDVTEACPLNLAPTASTTAQLAIGDALALAVSRRRQFNENDFQKHHPGGMLGAGLRKITEALRYRVGVNLSVIRDALTVRQALHEARDEANSDRRAGAIILVDDAGRLSGIFTDADLRRLIVRDPQGGKLDGPIRDVMTARPQHLMADDLVRDAVRLVRERQIDEIPVLDEDGRPIGLVDVQDLVAMKVVSE